MKIPKYVLELMRRSVPYDKGAHLIAIDKRTAYQQVLTFRDELNRLVNWAARQGGTISIRRFPDRTHYEMQYAVVLLDESLWETLKEHFAASW